MQFRKPGINQVGQSIVLAVLILSFLIAEMATYFFAGTMNAVLTQVFYLPVIILSFRYANRAVPVSVFLAAVYLATVLVVSNHDIQNLASSIMQFYVYISVGIVVGSLSSAIRTSEMKYRELFIRSGHALCLADLRSGTILEMNPKFREMFGSPDAKPDGDLLGRIFADPDTVKDIRQKLESGQAVNDVDIPVVSETGTREDYLLSATPLDADGLTVITLADVSRIKREDASALAESELKYRTLVELAQEGILAIDASGITTYVNPKLLEMLGYPGEQMLGHSLFEFLGEKSWIDVAQDAGTGTGKPGEEHEFEFIRNDGTRIVTSLSITPITASDGNFNGAIALVTDITGKKQAELALRESEERFRSIFESQMTGTLVINAKTHTITDANGKAVDLIGLPRNEIVGKICHQFICPSECGRCPVTDLGQTIDQSERVLINGKGERIPIMKFVTTLTMGGEQYLIETFTDITERKRNEEQLKSSLEEKSVLLMEVHHRVKNNLQIISGLIRLQSRFITNELALDALQQTDNRVTTMALVHESLYQSGNLANINARAHMTHLVTNLLMSDGEEQRIKMETDIEDFQLDLDTAIPASLIVNELVTNAMKYAFPGDRAGTIRISLRREPEGQLLLRIADDGVGLPEGTDPATAKSLGLKLVNRLVRDQLKGTLEIRGENGTQFAIRFPEKLPGGRKGAGREAHAG